MPSKPPPVWRLPGEFANLPDGTEIREETLGANTILLHVTYPLNTDEERIANFARAFSRELPKNARAVFTFDDIKINVHRPRSVSLTMNNNKVQSTAVLDHIQRLLDDASIHQIQISIVDNELLEEEKIEAVQPEVDAKKVKEVVKKAVKEAAPKKPSKSNGKSKGKLVQQEPVTTRTLEEGYARNPTTKKKQPAKKATTKGVKVPKKRTPSKRKTVSHEKN